VRILYVEDNATNVILVQRVANMGKHSVITYDNGEDALANFDHDAPDCVLMDVQLRGALTGLDVVAKLRERGFRLPIIALTAYAMKGDRQRCLDAGCDDYIPKPISVTELVSVFKRFNDTIASSRKATMVGGKTPFYKPPVELPPVQPAAQPTATETAKPAASSEPVAADAAKLTTATEPVVTEPATPAAEAAKPTAATEPAPQPLETPSVANMPLPTVQPQPKTDETASKETVTETSKEQTPALDVTSKPSPPVDVAVEKVTPTTPTTVPTSVES